MSVGTFGIRDRKRLSPSSASSSGTRRSNFEGINARQREGGDSPIDIYVADALEPLIPRIRWLVTY